MSGDLVVVVEVKMNGEHERDGDASLAVGKYLRVHFNISSRSPSLTNRFATHPFRSSRVTILLPSRLSILDRTAKLNS